MYLLNKKTAIKQNLNVTLYFLNSLFAITTAFHTFVNRLSLLIWSILFLICSRPKTIMYNK